MKAYSQISVLASGVVPLALSPQFCCLTSQTNSPEWGRKEGRRWRERNLSRAAWVFHHSSSAASAAMSPTRAPMATVHALPLALRTAGIFGCAEHFPLANTHACSTPFRGSRSKNHTLIKTRNELVVTTGPCGNSYITQENLICMCHFHECSTVLLPTTFFFLL